MSAKFPGRREKRREFRRISLFCENPSRKHLRSQSFEDGFPTRARREFFRARMEFFRCAGNEQGIPREIQSARPGHPIAPKFLSFADKKIINRRVMLRLRTNTLCFSGRAARAALPCRSIQAHPRPASTEAFEIGALS